jgi:hypothetical protein
MVKTTKKFFDLLFVSKTCVVGTDSDFHFDTTTPVLAIIYTGQSFILSYL